MNNSRAVAANRVIGSQSGVHAPLLFEQPELPNYRNSAPLPRVHAVANRQGVKF